MPLWNVVSGYCDEWVCLSKLFMPTSLGLEYVYHGDNGVIFVEESLNLRLIIFHFRWRDCTSQCTAAFYGTFQAKATFSRSKDDI